MAISILHKKSAEHRARQSFISLLVAFFLIYTLTASATMEMFLIIDDIKGESTDVVFPESIEVLSMGWGVSRPDSQSGGGGGLEAINIQDLSMTKAVDQASIELLVRAVTGDVIDSALLVVRKVGENPFEYFALELENVMVKSLVMVGSGGDDQLLENITLNFEKVTTHYRPQNDDGSAGPIKTNCYDVKTSGGC